VHTASPFNVPRCRRHLFFSALTRPLCTIPPQAQLVDAIEDTGFEANVIGLADSRGLVLSLEGWAGKAAEATAVEEAVQQQHGVLHVTIDIAKGSAEASLPIDVLCRCPARSC